MFKKLLAAPFIVLALLLFSYSVAAAWHATVVGKYTCEKGYGSIAWSVTNSENSAGSFIWSVAPSGQTGQAALKSNKGTTVVSTPVLAPGSYKITVTPSWPNNNEHPKAYYTVPVEGTCTPPTTTLPPVTTAPPTTVPPTTVPPTTVPPTTTPPVTVPVPPTSTVPSPPAPVVEKPTELAFTGTSEYTPWLVVAGLTLFFLGLAAVVVAGNKEEGAR